MNGGDEKKRLLGIPFLLPQKVLDTEIKRVKSGGFDSERKFLC